MITVYILVPLLLAYVGWVLAGALRSQAALAAAVTVVAAAFAALALTTPHQPAAFLAPIAIGTGACGRLAVR